MSNYTTEQERIIRLAEKLYRLGNGTSSDAEAESAIMKAQQLLNEYNLTIKDLGFFERDAKCSQRGIILKGATLPEWVRLLGAVIMEPYTCKAIFSWEASGGGRRKLIFVGVEPNASIAEHSFIIAYRHLMTRTFPPRTSQKAKAEFRAGFCDGLYLKLMEIKRSNDTQVPGLVVATAAVVAKAFAEMFPTTSKGRTVRGCAVTADYMLGISEGKDFSISAGVGAAKNNRQMAVGA